MAYEPGSSNRREELVAVIHRVRNRWRLKLALRGAVIVVAGTLLALLLSASSLEALRFSPSAIIAFRVIALIVFLGLVMIGFVQPLRRRVSDGQVALYLEEKDPTLQAAILSAIESIPAVDSANRGPSPALVERLVNQAIEKCHALEDGLAVERRSLRTQLFALGAIAAAAALLITFGPAFLRSGMSALLIISRSAEAASPYKIDVTPGNARVPKGADQNVRAKLLGFSSSEATLMVRTNAGQDGFERVPLVAAADPGAFEGMLFHVEKSADYYVESNGVRSTTFKMDVVDLPTVDKLVMDYHFPAYTGARAAHCRSGRRRHRDQGDRRQLTITPTMATPGGRVILNEKESLPLTKNADGTLAAMFTVKDQGFYKIELEGPAGEKVDASPQVHRSTCSPITTPSVRFNKPGRDTECDACRRGLRRGPRRRRLRREERRPALLGQRRRRENGASLRRIQVVAGSDREPHDLPRRARPEAGRLRVVLREGGRQRRRGRIADDDERHLLRADPAVQEGLQARAVDGWRRGRWWRRRPDEPALAAAARDRRGHLQHRSRPREDVGREVPRTGGVPHAGAGEAAAAGRGIERQDEQPARRRRPGVQDNR
ncbi:MAG: hypothetical protein QM736_17990 [Vicinamibacterales bacterium]